MAECPTVNVATHLAALAAREPNRAAVILPQMRREGADTVQLTFAELDTLSGQIARGLDEIGIRRGVRTVLMVRPSLDFFTLTFALFKVGAVPVLIDPGMGIRNLGKCLAEAQPEAFIGVPKAHLARRILRWAKSTIRITVTTGSRLFGGKHTVRQLQQAGKQGGPLPVADTRGDETAAILFTSGSTGIAKGAVYTHGIFAAQVEYLKSIYAIEPGEVDLCTFPLFALFAPALGMTVDHSRDGPHPAGQGRSDEDHPCGRALPRDEPVRLTSPDRPRRAIRKRARHQALDASPRRSRPGPRWPAKVIERFTTMLAPGVQVFTPYGATESLPVANIGSDTILKETRHLTDQGRGVCVGFPVPGIDVRIIPITDDPVPVFDESTCLAAGRGRRDRGQRSGRHGRVFRPAAGHRAGEDARRAPADCGIGWATSATSTSTAGSGSAVASRTAS